MMPTAIHKYVRTWNSANKVIYELNRDVASSKGDKSQ